MYQIVLIETNLYLVIVFIYSLLAYIYICIYSHGSKSRVICRGSGGRMHICIVWFAFWPQRHEHVWGSRWSEHEYSAHCAD